MWLYTLSFGNPMSAFLLRNIFMRDSKRRENHMNDTNESKIAQMITRKPFEMKYRFCFCLNRRKEKRLAETGLQRAVKELEVDRFILSQMKFRIAMKTIFTRVEQFLIQNNRSFLLNKHSECKAVTSSEHSDNLKDLSNDLKSHQPYLTRLLLSSAASRYPGAKTDSKAEVQRVEGNFRRRLDETSRDCVTDQSIL